MLGLNLGPLQRLVLTIGGNSWIYHSTNHNLRVNQYNIVEKKTKYIEKCLFTHCKCKIFRVLVPRKHFVQIINFSKLNLARFRYTYPFAKLNCANFVRQIILQHLQNENLKIYTMRNSYLLLELFILV